PTFLSLMENVKEKRRKKLLEKALITIFILMIIFALSGNLLLGLLRIGVDSVRFGGGILLLIISIDMLSGLSRTKTVEQEDMIVVPIASPLLVGPGTITTLLILAATYPIYLILSAIIIATLLVYITLRLSEKLTAVVGRNGVRAMGRIMSIIIAATAAEMIHSALLNWGIAKA
ncbi:MAG: MarC family protein, partial [Candidatus Bathyarchaeota archaeon]|nr:MarC family protein [Candidatus Bathyarchaeota archaeon]